MTTETTNPASTPAAKTYTPEEFLALPLSEMIRLAVADLEACRAHPDKFVIDMAEWVTPRNGGVCAVCFGGAALANRFGIQDITVADTAQMRIADALNNVRIGCVWDALEEKGVNIDELTYEQSCKIESVSDYLDDESRYTNEGLRAPSEAYLEAASRLAEVGL